MTKIIGLTGGIGSGKTTIAQYFHSFGIPLYIADDEAKKLMQSREIVYELKNTFGITIFENGLLNRAELAKIVFNDSQKLKQLNAIIHPIVKEHFNNWLEKNKTAPYIIYEAAILFESGSYKNCDLIITVTATIESRIQRVIERDKTTRDLVLKRIEAQWTDAQRILKSDYVIENDNLQIAKEKVQEILKILKIKQKHR